jgi:long-subunit fatty acid transport protein
MRIILRHFHDGKCKCVLCIVAIVVGFMPWCALWAQGIEDALRLTQSNSLFSPRALSLGVGYMGIADDFTAAFVNPAGLGFLRTTEFSLGLQSRSQTSQTAYFSGDNSAQGLGLNIGNIGVATSFGPSMGRFGFAVGFGTEIDFTGADSSGGINPRSTMINSWVQSPDGNLRDLAYSLALADTVRGRLFTPIQDSLYQGQYTIEQGRINNFVGALGFQVNTSFAVGVSLLAKFGSYRYERQYSETDVFNIYQRLDRVNLSDIDFLQMRVQESITQDITGIGIIIGGQYRIRNVARIGVSLQLPMHYRIQELYARTVTAVFDNNEEFRDVVSGRTTYSVSLPLIISFGGSVHYEGFTFTAGGKFMDCSQVQFADAVPEVMALNTRIIRALVPQMQYGIGCEYDGEQSPIAVRVSFSSVQSPFSDPALQQDYTVIAGGIGLYLTPGTRLDIGYARHTMQYQRLMYNSDVSAYRGTSTVSTISIGAVVRL